MTWGTMRVRNACPFPVTFYALAGPVIEIPANSTRSAKACLIWFSTRCKGGGSVISKGYFQQLQQDYQDQLIDLGYNAGDFQSGGPGAAVGSLIGLTAGALEQVFMVKNTSDGNTLYFGAKKEGVYGNADLVIYAELDKACRLDPKMDRLWLLRLDHDHGQQSQPIDSDPVYSVPDLSLYGDTIFFRARNVENGVYLYAKDDGKVGVRRTDMPFNPLTIREYWAVHPLEQGDDGTTAKLLNTATNKWLTCFSTSGNMIGLVTQETEDYSDQHWRLNEVSSNPEIAKLQNVYVAGNLASGASGDPFIHTNSSSDDQKWSVETCTVDIHKVPAGTPFRLMQASTGLYVSGNSDGSVSLVSAWSQSELYAAVIGTHPTLFVLEPHNSDDFRIVSYQYKKYLTFFENKNCLGLYDQNGGDYQDQHWKFQIESHQAGFYVLNQSAEAGGYNHLFHNGQRFGLYFGTYPDQLWVAVF